MENTITFLKSELEDVDYGYNFMYFLDAKLKNEVPQKINSKVRQNCNHEIISKQVLSQRSISNPHSFSSTINYHQLQQRDAYFHWRVFRNLYTAIVVLLFCSLVYYFTRDAQNRINSEVRQKSIQFHICEAEFIENECERPRPALRQFCLEKKNCLASDPEKEVTKISHVVMLVVEIFNTAVSKSNLKSLCFFLFLLFGLVILSILSKPFAGR